MQGNSHRSDKLTAINKIKKNIKFDAIVIGVSAGGMEALTTILPALPADFSAPIIIVQHMHPNSGNFLSTLLNDKSKIRVKEAEEKEDIVKETVYIAPANYHLLIENDRTFSLSIDGPVNYARPSIDVMFESAAEVYVDRLIGMILTGANKDGSKGLKKIKDMGGLIIVQDPATAEIDSMPNAAIDATEVDYIVPLKDIANLLIELKNNKQSTKPTI